MKEILKKIIKAPLNAIGFDLVRKTNMLEKTPKFEIITPHWKERIINAKSIGFKPKIIYDGGGFNGSWTYEAAQIFPNSQFVIMEPNPYMLEEIKKNTANLNLAPILYNIALGDSQGKAHFNIWDVNKTDPSASLLNHVSGDAHCVLEVEVKTIDRIVEETNLLPDLIKLDLQGNELAALKGAEKTLLNVEFVIVEFGCLEAYIGRTKPNELIEFMYKKGFCLYDVVDFHYRPYDNALTGGDFIFVKNLSILKSYKGWS